MSDKKSYQIYKNDKITEAVKANFKTTTDSTLKDTSLKTFKDKVGDPHPFNYKVIDKLEQRFALISAIEDKLCDYVLGPGLYIESDDEKVVDILESWKKKNELLYHARPWFRNALGKGSGYMEIAGLSEIDKSTKIKVVDSNTMYEKRDNKSNILGYNQFFGSSEMNISDDDVNELKKDNIIKLDINKFGNCAYGYGIVHSAISVVDNFLNANSAMHTIMRRKANSPIHVKLGNVEKEDYPEQSDIDAFGRSLQYMNETTEWTTGPNVEMKVLDFGKIGEKFKDILDHDLKMLAYSFQVPESVLGADKGYVGSSELQGTGFDRNVKAYQSQIAYVLKDKVFDLILLQEGIVDAEYNIVWGQQDEKSKNELRASYQQILSSNITLSPGMRKQYEKKLAELDDIDFAEVEKENQKEMRRANRDSSKSFNQQVQLKKVSLPMSKEEENIKHYVAEQILKGKAPQEIEMGLSSKFKLSEQAAFTVTDQQITNFDKDHSIEEWAGTYESVKSHIFDFIKNDKFSNLVAKNKADLAQGMLTKQQIEKVRVIFTDAFNNNSGINLIAKKLEKIKLKDRFVKVNGKLVLTVAKGKRPKVLARTESVRIKAESTLKALKDSGIDELTIVPGSSKVCSSCQEIIGDTFKVNEASGLLPVHPNCRCRIDAIR